MKWDEMNNLTRQSCIRACLDNSITFVEMERAWGCGKGTARTWYASNKDKDFSGMELGGKVEKKTVEDVCKNLLGDKYSE